jgi:conjugal transfer mating pair stabilization protein TraN
MWPTKENEGWGDEEDPNCGGFSIEQLQAIDFSKIDFSEYFDNIVVDLMPPDTATSGTSTDETNMQSQDCPYNPELYPELCQ